MSTSEVIFSLLMIFCLYPRDNFTVPDVVEEQVFEMAQDKPELFGCPIYINQATKEQLMTLPQIGEVRADEIIRYRSLKPFEHVDELLNIKGIGKKRLELLKSKIVMKPSDCRLLVKHHHYEAKN